MPAAIRNAYPCAAFPFILPIHILNALFIRAIRFPFAKRVISDFDYKGSKIGVIYGIDGDYQSIIADKILFDKKLSYEVVAFLIKLLLDYSLNFSK